MGVANIVKIGEKLRVGLQNGDPVVIGILATVVVGILTLLFLLIRGSGRNKRQGILLLGICDAGKTLVFSQLVHRVFKQTYTSIKPNSGEYVVPEKNKSLRIVDLPGHERLRLQQLDEFKALARAVVFVVDSGTLQKDIKEVAEYIYTVLSDKTISSNAPPVLIACNKQDLNVSKGAKVIRSQLEKEMNTLRITRQAALQGVGDTANNNTFLGKRDKDFSFSDLKPLRVDFAECSAICKKDNSEGCNLEEVESWFAKVA